MATDTEKLYNDTTTQTGAGTGTTTPTSTATATSPYVTGNTTLDNYNNTRYQQINSMYDAQRDNALNQLDAAHQKNMADAQAAYEKITPAYQESRNATGAEYERQRRNNNLQANANGLNTGAGSQMQLAASNVYQTNQTQLEKAEKDALAEADRQQLSMKQQYEADVADALSKNDAERAAALLNEYGQQYDRMQSEAKTLAAYGDFSLYKQLYGEAAAAQMEQAWLLQNPQLAYTMGKITPQQYFSMTGKWPNGYDNGSTAGVSSSGGKKSGGYYGGSGGGDTPTGSGEKYQANAITVQNAMKAGYSLDDIKANVTNPTTAEALYKTLSAMDNYGGISAQEASDNRDAVKNAIGTVVNNSKAAAKNATNPIKKQIQAQNNKTYEQIWAEHSGA